MRQILRFRCPVIRKPLRYSIEAACCEKLNLHQIRQQSGRPAFVEKPGDQLTKEDDFSVKGVLSGWNDRFPDVRIIKLKGKGKNAQWESIQVILSQHRDNSRRPRQRQVWFTFEGHEPTAEELALQWPKDKMSVSRKLRDDEEAFGTWDQPPRIFTVTEKTDSGGRRFWREVIKAGELNDEEESRAWHEWMSEEGHWAEIDRLMKKD